MRPLVAASVFLALAGCPTVSRQEWDSVQDQDGDGGLAVRFGGRDCVDDDDTIAVCDGDGDGHYSLEAGGDDCDDDDKNVVRRTFFRDLDGDRFGDPDAPVDACEAGSLLVADATDCDDTRADVRPGVEEECDLVDRNCDGDPYEGSRGGTLFWRDEDGDGFGGASSEDTRCVPGEGEVDNGLDCDDFDVDVFPGAPDEWYDDVDGDCAGNSDFDQDGDGEEFEAFGGPDCDDEDAAVNRHAPELCNGQDDDCDLRVDDDDRDDQQVGQVEYFRDGDLDGFGSDTSRQYCPGAQPEGWVLLVGDCDDRNSRVSPVAEEVCNDRDDDCDTEDDDNPVGGRLGYLDADGDGWGQAVSAGRYCGAFPAGVAARDGDCDDTDRYTFPGAEEQCGDAVRQDCDPGPADDCDLDGDPDATDCDDDDVAIRSTAVEVCDGVDNDCDTLVDGADPSVDSSTERLWYLDLDRDGFGSVALFASCEPPASAVDNGLDCDDTDPLRAPGAGERCNSVDDDCDTLVDEEPVDALPLYLDVDGDGFGDPAITAPPSCVNPDPATWTLAGADCAPTDPAVFPGAGERCDGGVDNDCDGLVDDEDTDVAGAVWFEDADGDGYGLDSDLLVACGQVAGRTLAPGDCDDGDNAVHPGADEVCNAGIDDDCDGELDEADASSGAIDWYVDADGDGYGAGAPLVACTAPTGRVARLGDCDDALPNVNPGEDERCDPGDLDEDCNLVADDADAVNRVVYFRDLDGDGYAGTPYLACEAPLPPTYPEFDCLDTNPAVRPGGGTEFCNGLDDDCDGTVDFTVPALVDQDGDGYGVGAPVARPCASLVGYTPVQDPVLPADCNDGEATARPDFPYEICLDGFDNDCNGLTDVLDPGAIACSTPGGGGTPGDPAALHLYWPDTEADGLGNPNGAPVVAASAPPGYVANALDCNPSTVGPSPTFVATAADLQSAVNGAPPGCNNIELAPVLFTGVTLNTPTYPDATTVLIGPLDGADARAVWEGGTVTVDASRATLVLTGVDFVPLGLPNGAWPIQVTNGTVGLYDLSLEDGGLKQTGGTVDTHLVDIVSPPPPPVPVGNPQASALWVDGGVHTSMELTILDAPGQQSGYVSTGTFTGLRLDQSSPFEVGSSAADVTLSKIFASDCTSDCLTLVGDLNRDILVTDSVFVRAAENGVETSATSIGITLRRVTIAGAGRNGLSALGPVMVRDSVVWGSGVDDLSAMADVSTSLWGTDSGILSVLAPVATGRSPGFQSFDARLDPARWDLHLAPGSNVAYDFQGGHLGAFPVDTDPWYDLVDADLLPDGWELQFFGTLDADDAGDEDGDGVQNHDEYLQGTWPTEPDTDEDGTDDLSDAAPLDGAVR
jgi:hypothetical protein